VTEKREAKRHSQCSSSACPRATEESERPVERENGDWVFGCAVSQDRHCEFHMFPDRQSDVRKGLIEGDSFASVNFTSRQRRFQLFTPIRRFEKVADICRAVRRVRSVNVSSCFQWMFSETWEVIQL
jgi:hypothetical protein